jgi:hypothetical protein
MAWRRDARAMRFSLSVIAFAAFTAPALAQFPPPGIYACTAENGDKLGSLSLLVAGDYQWQGADGTSVTGQVASASTSLEALTGPLAEQHWKGAFETVAGKTTFVFQTDAGKVVCK